MGAQYSQVALVLFTVITKFHIFNQIPVLITNFKYLYTSVVFESVPMRISLGQFQIGKCLCETVTD